jgi:YebC/PmpR family DNA-binding regulatory protein
MSGHSKWATIKHKKGAADAKRGKLFTKLIKEITVSARLGGGDLTGNPRLRKAVNDAKGQQMPADTIKRALQRGTGEVDGVNYEEVVYEGTGPGGTLFIIEVMTDNKNRTVAEIRKVFEKNNGALGTSGSAMWAFDRVGLIALERDKANEDQLMEIAVGAGANDYSDQGEEWQIQCELSSLDAVTTALTDAGMEPKSSGPAYVPKSKKLVSGRDAENCLNMYDTLDDHDDVQNAYSDFDVSDEELARIAG